MSKIVLITLRVMNLPSILITLRVMNLPSILITLRVMESSRPVRWILCRKR